MEGEQDWEQLCARQKEEMVGLRETLGRKEREVEEAMKIARKYASVIPELRHISLQPALPHSQSSSFHDDMSDYWGASPQSSDCLNFESIAAKGLWVVSSNFSPKKTAIRRFFHQKQSNSTQFDAFPTLNPQKTIENTQFETEKELKPVFYRSKIANLGMKTSLQRIAEITVGEKRGFNQSKSPNRTIKSKEVTERR